MLPNILCDQDCLHVFLIITHTLLLVHERHGAEEAHGAHNPGVTGSKPVVAIIFLLDSYAISQLYYR